MQLAQINRRPYPSHDEMLKVCAPNARGQRLVCAHVSEGKCTVYLAPQKELEAAGYTDVLAVRHEIGHCNGWGPDHAGMRARPTEETFSPRAVERHPATAPSRPTADGQGAPRG